MNSLNATEERRKELVGNYEIIANQVQQLSLPRKNTEIRLVAVSKLKPSSDIKALYDIGVRHFGENYVQELIEKSQELPKDIKWHFIGGLQSGKCKDLAKKIENLYAVETLDSLKKCQKLDAARSTTTSPKINVYLQINTSDESQKSGYSLEDLDNLYETIDYLISDKCTKLKFEGLMTIGSFSESLSEDDENRDFSRLVDLKKKCDEKYHLDLQLSMGMSNDFKQAIIQGSTNVRVGSSIFGARPSKN
ncbi:uncharacterized protein PRCAT00001579001 [Priceomyces carsonii]|uniref:uncharacterized protein n=1 Tax=Priceomyces carsonii TaxID=28549 RepID=UPI002EDAEA39|nr:unnamed protein product [Priceomyces carsonii]